MTECAYCGCRIEAHDPVYVSEGTEDGQATPFCNYGCLSAHIDEAGLATDTACEWSPAQ